MPIYKISGVSTEHGRSLFVIKFQSLTSASYKTYELKFRDAVQILKDWGMDSKPKKIEDLINKEFDLKLSGSPSFEILSIKSIASLKSSNPVQNPFDGTNDEIALLRNLWDIQADENIPGTTCPECNGGNWVHVPGANAVTRCRRYSCIIKRWAIKSPMFLLGHPKGQESISKDNAIKCGLGRSVIFTGSAREFSCWLKMMLLNSCWDDFKIDRATTIVGRLINDDEDPDTIFQHTKCHIIAHDSFVEQKGIFNHLPVYLKSRVNFEDRYTWIYLPAYYAHYNCEDYEHLINEKLLRVI